MWYHFHKKDNSSRMAVLSRLRNSIDYKDPADGRIRKFVFLGTTEGRLRSGEVCFFEESPDLTAKDVREAFGDLSGVFMKDGVGKYVARTGLSFTNTWETIRVEQDQVAVVDDVSAPDGKDYTDGCGCIALEAAEKIAVKLGLAYTPTGKSIWRRSLVQGVQLTSFCSNRSFPNTLRRSKRNDRHVPPRGSRPDLPRTQGDAALPSTVHVQVRGTGFLPRRGRWMDQASEMANRKVAASLYPGVAYARSTSGDV